MRATIKAKAVTAEVAADDPAVVPGSVRLKAGLFAFYFSPEEAREIGRAAIAAADAADKAKAAEK